MKLSKSEFRIIWAAGLLLTLSAIFMFTDFGDYLFRDMRSGQAVGQFSQWNKDVRHKWNSEFTWRNVHSTGVVEENDYVFAGDESSATVEFFDGFILQVEPQSLVKIERESQQTVLAFNFGLFNLSGTSQKPIVIRTKQGKSKIILSKTAKVVIERKSKTNTAVMTVVEGTANVEKEGEGLTAPFSAGDAFNFEVPEATVSQSVTTEAKLPDLKPEPISIPNVEDTINPIQDQPANSIASAPEPEALEKTATPIEGVIADQMPENTMAQERAELPEVAPQPETFAEASSAQEGAVEPQIELVANLNRPRREEKRDGKKQSIELALKNFSAETGPIEIEVANNKKFKGSKIITANKSKVSIEKENSGPVYFRVKQKRSVASVSQEKAAIAKVIVPEPVLLTPAPSQRPRSNELLILPSAKQGLDFRWSAVKDATMYDFQLARDPEFKEIVASQVIDGKTELYLSGEFSSGSYFWRVRSATAYDESTWSKAKKFQLVIPSN